MAGDDEGVAQGQGTVGEVTGPSESMIAAGMSAIEDGYYASWNYDCSVVLDPKDARRMVVDVWRAMFHRWLVDGAEVRSVITNSQMFHSATD